MNIYIKKFAILLALANFIQSGFARTQYNENTLVGNDVDDNQIIVDSNSKGNVKVLVAENVSLSGNSLSVYGADSQMEFLGGNKINLGNISIYGGANISARSASIKADNVYLEETGASLFLKDCSVSVNGILGIKDGTSFTIDGGDFSAKYFTPLSGILFKPSAEIKVLNEGSLNLTENGLIQLNNYNIYVDGSSSFSSASRTVFSGKLSFEEGANISFSNTSNIGNMSFEFVVDDISVFQDKELNEYFETITLAGSSIENLITSENLTVYDKSTNMAYNIRISDSGKITVIPEPSACAAIFGALALAFAAWRARK